MTEALEDYKNLVNYGKETKTLISLSHLLSWDQETKMPQKAIEFRGEQMQLLSGLIHERATSTQLRFLLDKLISLEDGSLRHKNSLDFEQLKVLQEWRKDFHKQTKLPKEFVKKFAQTTSTAVQAWSQAKKNNNFQDFLPFLEKIILLCREKAHHLGFQNNPYDALLDEHEPSMTTQILEKNFEDLKPFLLDLTKKLSSKTVDLDILHGEFASSDLMDFCLEILDNMGLEKGRYRLDLSEHPFCLSLHPTDVRITTHLSSTNLLAGNISAVMHEGGHALYEMGLPQKHFGTPLCEALSLGLHESQSRFWETIIGQSYEFWQHFFPQLQKKIKTLSELPLNTFYQAINNVSPSFIRVHADEVTYGLHIILRFDLEKDLINGDLKAEDLPSAWNEKMEKYFGIKPSTYSEGCLQDIHWAWGLFGYFPTYLLGNLYASQFYHQFQKDYPDYKNKISQGQLIFIKDWLHEKIHRHGRLYSQNELIKQVSGHSLSSQFFKDYLQTKYL